MARLAIISVAGWGETGACAARRVQDGALPIAPAVSRQPAPRKNWREPPTSLACALLQYHTVIYTRILGRQLDRRTRRGLEISSVTTSARACDLHCCQQ